MPSQQPTVGLALHLGEVGPLADNDVDQCEVGDLRVGLGPIVADNPTSTSDNPVSEATIDHFVWKIPI